MGLIASFAFILATQTVPGPMVQTDDDKMAFGFSTTDSIASQSRIEEIWDHIDNRFVTQTDIWYDQGEFPSCVAILRVQSAYSPDDYEMMTNLGWMLENIERYDEARDIYLEFGMRHPKDADAMYALGFFYYSRKEYAKAIEVLEPRLALSPRPNTFRALARAYEMSKKPNDAIRVWELELKKYPGELAAIANIKRVKAKMASGGK